MCKRDRRDIIHKTERTHRVDLLWICCTAGLHNPKQIEVMAFERQTAAADI